MLTGLLEIARAALAARAEPRTLEMRDVAFISALAVDDEAPRELSAFDPYPEWLGVRARSRSQAPDGSPISSPVRPLLIRPGDSLRDVAGTPTTVRVAGHAWPYTERRILEPVLAGASGAG